MGLFGPDRMSLELEEINYRPDDVVRGTVQLKLDKPTKHESWWWRSQER